MSFAELIADWDWDDLSLTINGKTAADVRRALAKPKRDLNDFQALISPAAEPFLEQMAQQAAQLTRQRFGNTIQLYIPLYLSNMCSNICTYCGFSMHNPIRRKTLDMVELRREAEAIKQMGFDHLLLVTGESERKVGMAYFAQALPLLREYFSHISMEVQPLAQDEYEQLISLGLDTVLVYQETYHRRTYAEHHTKGKKRDFDWRLATAERLGRAGINKIGLGALIGLDDWRVDSFHVAAHLHYLEQQFWKTRYSLSFPRLRPCTGGLQPKSIMNDRQLVQLICAYRLLNSQVEISLSTRESATFRDQVLPLGITTMSAFSQTQPGGYADGVKPQLEQFEISDERRPEQVVASISRLGFQPVWKDWDRALT
ncbi:2-iminoacetate synthase ThiH [Corallincola holothuriorum]|uniref:2-iminoacetate synthase ThiH n=1 Tax=Corallincola holothuriorum TaxID=2282215 RepID=A0A368NKX7_9GAMM|nr:2-iminoacetate synthase ThiH [Corallincola holothuriorum]RCU50816.1 2-iminoacetate synthase ThiH [Corallincola holothuriorum]